jgi:hypothetical protein
MARQHDNGRYDTPRGKRQPKWVWAVAVGAVILAAGAAVVGAFLRAPALTPSRQPDEFLRPKGDLPSASREGETWGFVEVVAYIHAEDRDMDELGWKQSTLGTDDCPAIIIPAPIEGSKASDEELVQSGFTLCFRHSSPSRARVAAGREDRPSFAWGRFLFVNHDAKKIGSLRKTFE